MIAKHLILSIVSVSLIAFPTLADEAKVDDGIKTVDIETEAIFETINDTQREQFARILTGHGIIKSTEHTLSIVRKATASCGEHNPDLKSDFKDNFAALTADANPIIKKAKSALRRTIALEDVLPKSEMNAHLKRVDEQALEQASKVEPLPITRLEDCQKLLDQLITEKETHRLKDTLNETFGF